MLSVGLLFVVLFFVPFIHVVHPNTLSFFNAGLAGDVITPAWYSPMQFVRMMFDNDYDLRGWLAMGIVQFVTIISTLFLVLLGVLFLIKSRNKKTQVIN